MKLWTLRNERNSSFWSWCPSNSKWLVKLAQNVNIHIFLLQFLYATHLNSFCYGQDGKMLWKKCVPTFKSRQTNQKKKKKPFDYCSNDKWKWIKWISGFLLRAFWTEMWSKTNFLLFWCTNLCWRDFAGSVIRRFHARNVCTNKTVATT